jgi:hypothetical protein
MSEEIRRIIKMVKDGQITEDEAVRLMEAATKTASTGGETHSRPADDAQWEDGDAGSLFNISSFSEAISWFKRNLSETTVVFFLVGVVIVVLVNPRTIVVLAVPCAVAFAVVYLWRKWRRGHKQKDVPNNIASECQGGGTD